MDTDISESGPLRSRAKIDRTDGMWAIANALYVAGGKRYCVTSYQDEAWSALRALEAVQKIEWASA